MMHLCKNELCRSTLAFHSLHHQNEAAKAIEKKQKKDLAILKDMDLSQYHVKGSEEDWNKALSAGSKQLVSIKGWVHLSKSDILWNKTQE